GKGRGVLTALMRFAHTHERQHAEGGASNVVLFAGVAAFASGTTGAVEMVGGPRAIRRLVLREPIEAALDTLLGLHVAATFAQQDGAVLGLAAAETAGQQALEADPFLALEVHDAVDDLGAIGAGRGRPSALVPEAGVLTHGALLAVLVRLGTIPPAVGNE